MKNLRSRLEHSYKDKARLVIRSDGEWTIAEILLNIEVSEPETFNSEFVECSFKQLAGNTDEDLIPTSEAEIYAVSQKANN